MKRIIDACVILAPVLLLSSAAVPVGLWAMETPIPPVIEHLFLLALAVNLVQVLFCALHLGLRWQEINSRGFWLGVVSHYASVGAAFYYLVCVRNYPVVHGTGDSYRQDFRRRVLGSQFTWMANFATSIALPLVFVGMFIGVFAGFMAKSDLVFLTSLKIGLLSWIVCTGLGAYLVTVLVRDSIVRHIGSREEMAVAREIYSSFYIPVAIDRYLRAVWRLERSGEDRRRA